MLSSEYVTDDLEEDESEKEHNQTKQRKTREEVKIEPTCTVSSVEKKRGTRQFNPSLTSALEGGWQRSPVILGAQRVPCSFLSS